MSYTLSLYIPRMHLQISKRQITHTMECCKIGVVSAIHFVYPQDANHKSAFVHFQYFYPTKDTTQLLRQLRDGDYFKLYPFANSWTYWLLLKANTTTKSPNTHIYFPDNLSVENNLEVADDLDILESGLYEYDSV